MNKIKSFVFLFIFLISIVGAMAIPPFVQSSDPSTNQLQLIYPKNDFFKQNSNIVLHFHIVNSNGTLLNNTQVSCLIHIYNSSGNHIYQGVPANDANLYDKDVSLNSSFTADDKSYPYNLFCNSSQGQAGYLSASYEVTSSGYDYNSGSGVLVALIILPLLFGLILLIGSIALSEDHTALKIAMFLLSPIMTFISLHFGTVALIKYYGFSELQNNIGSTTYLFAMILFVILLYFIIYFIYKAIGFMAQKKEEKLNY